MQRSPFLAVLSIALGVAAALAAVQDPVVSWLQAHAIPLKTVDPSQDLEDLRPVVNVIGKASIVSLGEATHGTHEFFRLKHRLIELLASDLKFGVFAMEANMPDACRVNVFVLRGEGDPADLVRRLNLWVWDTREILDLVLWMRDFNRSGKGRIEFAGFDMGDPRPAMENVRRFIADHDPEYLPRLTSALAFVQDPTPRPERLTTDLHAASAAWDQVVAQLNSARERYVRAGVSVGDADWAVQNATLVRQFFEMRSGEFTRDDSMAQNLRWIRERANPGRIIVWAHNGHVAAGGGIVGPESMGTKLRRLYGGRDMVIVGFSFYEGSFRAVSNQRRARVNFRVPPAPQGSLDAEFAATGIPMFLIDLRAIPSSGVVGGWFRQRHRSREIGAEYVDYALFDQMYDIDARANFDAMIFVRSTTPTMAIER
jgi:erythromycin esterase